MSDILTLDEYLEMRYECYEKVLATTIDGVTELAEYEVEERCDEAVGKQVMLHPDFSSQEGMRGLREKHPYKNP